MATYNSTTFGAISGRHGSAVAAISKDGKCILKVYKAPSNPNTERQVVQRTKFGFVNKEMNVFRNLFKLTFGGSQGVSKGVSLAFGAVSGEYPDFSMDYSKLIISQGNVDTSGFLKATKTTGTNIKIEWDATIGFQGDDNDGVNLVFVNDETKVGQIKQNIVLRSEGSTEIALPEVWVGQKVHCWIFFSTPDGYNTSNSQYIDLIQL